MRTHLLPFASLLVAGGVLAVAACADAQPTPTPQPTVRAGATQPALTPTTLSAQPPQPSPTCTAGRVTPSQTEGPYFKAGSQERTSLIEPGTVGAKLLVTGRVLSRDCKPVAGALLDFWQADGQGDYDNAGYKLRGHQTADGEGRYRLETVLPGLYPGRTRHIHVKVAAPNKPTLTTQLYFPGEARNSSDSIFDQALVVSMQDTATGKLATFDFVLG